MSDWIPVRVGDPAPPKGALLDVITESGDQRQLRWSEGLWWLPGMEMYVYFTPAFWRLADTQ